MKRKVLPTPAEAKAEPFGKYDDPTARPTTSFESGNPMRKDAPTKTKMIIYFIIKRLKHRIRRAYSPLVPCTKTKRPDFEIRPFPSQRLRLRTTVLNYLDSNQERQNQNLLCYHYTIVQSDARKQVQRYGKESKFQKNPPRMVSLRKISTKKVKNKGPNHRTHPLRHRDCGAPTPSIKSIIQCSKI